MSMTVGPAGPTNSPTAAPTSLSVPDAEAAVRADLDAHGGELLHVIRRALDDDELAREVLQDVFVRAWRAHDRYDPATASRRTWLFAIARNAVIDAVRSRQRRPRAVSEPGEGDLVTGHAAIDVADRLSLEVAMRTLSDEHRSALLEVHVRGRSYDDVASELDVPVGTVRSRVFYALRKLRDTMIDQGWTHG
jgi:RNA polymerase sigma-70 factor, ECF subfamily